MSKKAAENKILKEIREKDIKIHSKHYFVLLTLLTVLSAVLLTTLSAILAKLWLDDVGHIRNEDLLGFGPRGRGLVAGSFPWLLTLITATSIWATVLMFRKLDISYKRGLSIFYSGIAIALVLMIIAVSSIDAHKPFERFSGPRLGDVLDERVLQGELEEIVGDTLVLEVNGDKIYVDLSDAHVGGLPKEGAPVRVLGEWVGEDEYRADAVRFSPPLKQVKGYRLK